MVTAFKDLNINAKVLSIQNNDLDGGPWLFLLRSNTFIAKSNQIEKPLIPKAEKIRTQHREVYIM